MSKVDCREWKDEWSESARRGARPAEPMSAHLRECASCRERWAAEESLNAPMRALRGALAGERSPDIRRRQLLAEFDHAHRPAPRAWLAWAWSAAAVVVLVAGILIQAGRVPPVPDTAPAGQDFAELAGGFPEVTAENGFVPVPFSQPLAKGESVRILRREMDGVELASMGFRTPLVPVGAFEADVVLGEDGLPRAVHLLDYDEF